MEIDMYKIVCDDRDVKFNYVGSTKDFSTRKSKHKANSNDKKYGHRKLYKVINEHGGWLNWTTVKIESCICETTLDTRISERYLYEELNANMNTYRPMRTSDELKEYMTEHLKKYQNDNKAEIAEYQKQYKIDNKETIASRKCEKIHCEACEINLVRCGKSQHNKSPKHLANINKLQSTP